MIIQDIVKEQVFNKWWLEKQTKVFFYPFEWKENKINTYSIYKKMGQYSFELVSCLDRDFIKLELLEVKNDVDLNTILAKRLLVKI